MIVRAGTNGKTEIAVDALRFVGGSRHEKAILVQTDRKQGAGTDADADTAAETFSSDGGDGASLFRLLSL